MLRARARRTLVFSTFAARLGLANSLLIILVCSTSSWVLARRYVDHVSSQLTERGRAITERLARDAGRSMMAGLHDLEQQARAEGGIAYIRFFDAHGLLLVSGGRPPVEAPMPAAGAEHEVGAPVAVGEDVWEFQAPIVASDVPLADRGQRSSLGGLPRSARADVPQRLGTVAVGVSLESLTTLRSRTLGSAVLSTSLFALLAVLAAVRLARAITRPLGALASAADTVARGDFNVQVEVQTDDEIGRLAHSFNAMVESLRRSATLEDKVRELQEVTRLKSEFLAAVSHELRTPLNVIIGYTDMLTAGAGGDVTTEQAEMLDAVRRYSKLQLELINNVLDYSRLVSGKVSFHVERFALAPMLEEILAMHRARRRDQPALLTLSVDPAVPVLQTDRIKLHEIVRNLVDNAVKFTSAGMVGVKAWPGNDTATAVIEVTDTGPGIGPDDLQTIFDAFEQAGRVGTRAAGGVGLGLSIAKQLVDALGGTISVASRLGEGSTFRVEVPCVLPGEHALAPVPALADGRTQVDRGVREGRPAQAPPGRTAARYRSRRARL
jgi:signal transduction histidine kinase